MTGHTMRTPKASPKTLRESVDFYEAHDLALDHQHPILNEYMRTMLKKLMVERNSPKAKLFIKTFSNMSNYASVIERYKVLYELEGRFASCNPDRITRRAAYLELAAIYWQRLLELKQIEDFCDRHDLFDESTKLPPDLPWMTEWNKSCAREVQRQAQFARNERRARRRIKARAARSKASPSSVADNKKIVENRT